MELKFDISVGYLLQDDQSITSEHNPIKAIGKIKNIKLMYTTLKQTLLTNWYPMRWVVLGIGLFFAISWLTYGETIAGFISLFFLFQAVTNTGCMVGRCAVTEASSDSENKNIDDVHYKEIK